MNQVSNLKSQISNLKSQIPSPKFQISNLWDFVWIFSLSLILRIVLIVRNPAVYEFDAYIYLLGLSSQYPLFTGFVKLLISCDFSVFMIRVVTTASASFGCFVFYLFTLRVFESKPVARAAVFLMSIYPSFLAFSLVPYTEPFFILIFFIGLWFFTKEIEAKESSFAGTGFFIGLACLTRFEAVLMVPLISGTIIWQNPKAYFSRKSVPKLLRICLALFWGPALLVIINYFNAPDLTVSQSKETGNIIKGLFPLLCDMIRTGGPKLLREIKVRGLSFPMIVFLAGCVLSGIGCMAALFRDRKRHLLFIVFIVLAAVVQLVPIASNYKDYPGRIIGLRRHGMISAVFLLPYLCCCFDLLIKRLPRGISGKKIFRILALLALLICPGAASFKAADFLISDYQKLYRNSYIKPYWIGKPGDAESGILAWVSEKVLMIHMRGTGLKIYSYQKYAKLPAEELEIVINQNQIRYVFIERDFFPVFERFMRKSARTRFRKLAGVGGWLLVYERIN